MAKRPLLLTIIAILGILAGIFWIVDGASYFTLGLSNPANIAMGIILIGVGMFYLIGGYFIFTGNSIGWWIFFIVTIISIIMSIISLVTADFAKIGDVISYALALAIDLIFIWYFLRKQTQDFFGVSFPIKF